MVWTYDTQADGAAANFHGDPVVVEDSIITGSDHPFGGLVYAFERHIGEVRWKRDVGGLESELVASGDLVIGAASHGGLMALDRESGEIAWQFETRRPGERGVAPTPAVAHDRVYFGARDGHVYALSTSGAPIWETAVGAGISTSTLVLDSHLYVGTRDDELVRLDVATGRIETRLALPARPHHGLATGGDCLVTLVGRRRIACAELDLSGLRWSRSTEEEWTTFNPLVLGDLVIVGSASDELFAFSLSDGSTAWALPLEGALRGLGATERLLYVGTIGGTIYALEMPSAAMRANESP